MRLLHVYASLACTPVTSSRSPVLEKHQPRTSQTCPFQRIPVQLAGALMDMHLSHSFLYTSHRRLRILKTEQATLARAACRQCGALSEPDPPTWCASDLGWEPRLIHLRIPQGFRFRVANFQHLRYIIFRNVWRSNDPTWLRYRFHLGLLMLNRTGLASDPSGHPTRAQPPDTSICTPNPLLLKVGFGGVVNHSVSLSESEEDARRRSRERLTRKYLGLATLGETNGYWQYIPCNWNGQQYIPVL